MTLDKQQCWQAIDTHRSALVGVLDQLTEPEWATPSLCDGWTVREVVGHFTIQQVALSDALRMAVKARGNTERAIREHAAARALLPTAQLVAQFRAQIGTRRHAPLVTYRELLIDVLVHSLDITIPLGRELALPTAAAATAATRVRTMRWPVNPWNRLHGIRLVATDADWAGGDGAEVSGPINAILLVLTGRRIGLDRLTGPGLTRLAAIA